MSRLRSRMLMMEPMADTGIAIIGEGTSLVGRWFTTNAVTDLSGNGNTATLVGGATYDTDIPTVLFPATHSLILASDGDRATVGNSASLNPTAAMSFSVWVKRANNNSGFYLGRGGGSAGYSFGNLVDNANLYSLLASAIVNDSDGQSGNNVWTHVCWTGGDPNGWMCYVNGVQTGDIVAWRAPGSSASDTEIGRGENNNALTAVGRLFDPRIYNVELSAAQVALIAAGNG